MSIKHKHTKIISAALFWGLMHSTMVLAATTHEAYAPARADMTKTSVDLYLQKLADQIHWSGQVNVAGFGSNYTPNTVGVLPNSIGSSSSASALAIQYSRLTADAKISEWVKGLINIAYEQRSPSFIRNPLGGGDVLFVDKLV